MVGNGEGTEGDRGGSPHTYITILAHFPSENQNQLKHQIEKNKKKNKEEMKEKQNADFLSNPGDGGKKRVQKKRKCLNGNLGRVKTPISWCFSSPLSISFSVSLRCSSFSWKIYIYILQMRNSVPARRNKIITMENNHNKTKTQPWKHQKETGWVSNFPCGVPLTSVTMQDYTSSLWYFFFKQLLLPFMCACPGSIAHHS